MATRTQRTVPAVRARSPKARARRSPSHVCLSLTIDGKTALAVDIKVDRDRFPPRFFDTLSHSITAAMRTLQDRAGMPTADYADPEPESASPFSHLENAAKAHEQMRKRGALFCPECGTPLTVS